ncbi:hypothetical protein ACIBO5_55910 [Nonomuraea angiospora]|uniref:hypothetical protein n=1 Tax=Nonomuraea angiospora TaxID=46172 RepID=UPI0029A2878A|nr:hypothetical protein [Nonomuraea angiospora]MDX3104530.1 hypothetical protein [Nonomuraea angiospora]
MRYTTEYALIPARRRKWIIGKLLAGRVAAAEVRAFTMRGFLLCVHDAVATAEQDVRLALARRQTITRLVGEALGGVASVRRWSTPPSVSCSRWPSPVAAQVK